jgi:hypothetical protein
MAFGQAEQRDRLTGQASLFDGMAADESALERPLPRATEAPARERLRWEKELLGLYLSDHPLGELAAEMGQYTNAYSGDMGEELDQQRIVIGGVVTGVRRVITRAKATMAVATLEDLQGSVDVVVFPKVLEETAATWQEDAILLVAGRVDHKGEETVVLADSVWTWETAVALGPEAFGRAVTQGDRRRGGNGQSPAGGHNGQAEAVGVPVNGTGNGTSAGSPVVTRTVPRVSPLRGRTVEGTIQVVISGGQPPSRTPVAVPMGIPAPVALPVAVPVEAGDSGSDEPPWPEEVARQAVRVAQAPTMPLVAGPGQALHVRFGSAPHELVVQAFETIREVLNARPGDTPVVLHIPAGGGHEQEMQLRSGVAYDAELLSEIGRRVGGVADLRLA